ncbi:hypothetical protein MLD38_011340 [Melastoma candidum]|uniref:Uncharacterized protein n=1 Tax=Melastoma candidum TaxID=119954 RepID=A0ACB9R2U2_9MYRT|nr:hypothetical protein MLD38_011340 [Melastoma candidum]
MRKLWKRAAGVIKDKNSLWVASVSRRSAYRNPDLEASVIKATSHDEARIDYKNAQRVYSWIRASPALHMKPLLWSLSYRMDRTRSWVVAIKGLMLLHGVFCCKLPVLSKIGRLPFDLSNFSDAHSSASRTWGYDAFVRAYFTFLDQKSTFLSVDGDLNRKIKSKDAWRAQPIIGDIHSLQKLQSLLDLLLQIRPQMECMKTACLIREAMDCVIIEIFDVYSKICHCIAIVLSKIYTATRVEASMALSVLQQANTQGDELSRFFEFCRSIRVLNASEFLKVERIPDEDIREVERIANETPTPLDRKNRELELAIVPAMNKEVELAIVPVVQGKSLHTVVTDKWEVFEDDLMRFQGICPSTTTGSFHDGGYQSNDVRTLAISTNPFITSADYNFPCNVHHTKQEIPDLISF